MDAAPGTVERGRWHVRDLGGRQPWLPNGSLPLRITRRHPQHHPAHRAADGKEAVT
ncbi:DUF3556 domain-containing protein [Streptomyces sp. NPDC053792]|uniref:DUF3556 domain-containing protein n=1 Tax=Streptomyces sp. NPDC053792 TaxID=3365716 RepID=UPI0037D3C317